MARFEHDELKEALNSTGMEEVQRNANGFWIGGCLPIALSALLCTIGSELPIDNMAIRESMRWGSASVLVVIGSVYLINFWKNRNKSE